MLRTLTNNIKRQMNRKNISFHKYQLSKDSTRILFFFKNEDIPNAVEVLKRSFGIHSLSPALRTSNRMKNIIDKVVEVGEELLDANETFALRVKRSGKHDFSSQDVARKGGEAILNQLSDLNLKVDLGSPDKRIFVEVRGEFSYLYTDIIKSKWGGLPTERVKKILVMDVGRREDLLGGFLLARRGSEIYPVLFNLMDEEGELEAWKSNWEQVSEYLPFKAFSLRIIDLKPIMDRAIENLQDKKFTCAVCRLIRFDLISRLLKVEENKDFMEVKAVSDGVTHNNNQTICDDMVDLESIALSLEFMPHPIFTPVIGLGLKRMEKWLSRISNNLDEIRYCKYAPKDQEIKIDGLRELYRALNLEKLVKKSLNEMKIVKIF